MATIDSTKALSSQTSAIASSATEPASFYEAQLAESTIMLTSLQQNIKTIALYRLLAGISIILTIYQLFRTYGSNIWWLALCILIIIFIFLLRRSGDLQEAEAYQTRRKQINERELAGLDGQFGAFDGGEGIVGPEHPYAFDLDLFGENSLFQRINRSVTNKGKILLGRFLSESEQDSLVIRERQSMVAALEKEPEWCQQFLITGSLNEEGPADRSSIEEWLKLAPDLYPSKTWKYMLTTLPAVTVAGWLLFMFGPLPAWPAIVLSLIQLGITGNKAKMINESHQLISKRAGTLKKYHNLVHLFAGRTFGEAGLNKLHTSINRQEQSKGSFRKFIKLIAALDNRLNIIMNIVLNGLLLWDLNCLYRIEHWKNIFKEQFPLWISVSSELDSLISLAFFNFNHPGNTTPTILDKSGKQDFMLDIQSGRHPLLYPEPSIPNDLHQPANLNLYLITGANMAGKSTFLRMVGLNMVLAMAGANVAAEAMTLTPVALYTSMRTNDSLFTHTSFFYAELKKLQSIMEQIKSERPVYIMLDEILKGTNSRDQHLGSAALIKNIIRYKGRGLIATHDIELTDLVNSYQDNIKNIAFEIDMEGDKMIFSYQYRDGVCQNMNASTLMKQMGII
ncbi:MutS-related protein [Arachidicoccus terrestris]|uniref:MutS-related protein n=1 Tax=Arachidicoccus terrestris TaxID=2875539 RepID=UPI001CC545D4|nr:hypothetical protein [Arachidicoccus terrestris]UAY54812.1 hypothetical protein K9M52_15390 [Arachidicoccus terrestris]